MSEEREPVRLRDDPNEDRGLRDMLEAARGETANDAMLDRVLAGVLASGGGGGGGSGGGGAAAKIAAGVAAVAATAGVVALMISSSSSSSNSSSLAHPIAPADAAIVADAWTAPDAAVVDAGTDAFVRIAHITPRPPPPPPTIAEPAETDGALLMRATREHDASLSLSLSLEHRAQFPNSPSAEDREALIVIDLARLNRTTDARDAADAFFARWPRSADRSRIETALARMH